MIIILAKIRFPSLADRDLVLKERAVSEKASQQEPGLIEYRSTIDPYDPLLMHALEIFVSGEAFTAHHASAHMKTLVSKIGHIKTEVTAKAFEGDLIPFDLGQLIKADTFGGESGSSAISVTVA
jgi:quinol monooxygenase YgiN